MHQISFWLGSVPDPAGGARSALRLPSLILKGKRKNGGHGKEVKK